jgi:putative hydrolase of the HAD superfamily
MLRTVLAATAASTLHSARLSGGRTVDVTERIRADTTWLVPDGRHEVRALVIDYGEVLCHAADPGELAEMAKEVGADSTRFAEAYWEHREAYDRGKLDGPAYWRRVGETIGIPVDDVRVGELVLRDIALWTRLDDEMLAWANAVAGTGVPVGLLSNMVREIGDHLRDELRLFERFTSVTYSYEVGLAKPDPEIYHCALQSLGTTPGEALFVDDRAVNVEAARSVGMHVHHFRSREGLVADVDARYALASAVR